MTAFFPFHRFIKAGPLLFLLFAGLLPGLAHAHQVYLTTLELKSPVTEARIDRVEFLWSGDARKNHASRDCLRNYSVVLFSGDDVVYANKVMFKNGLYSVAKRGGGNMKRTRKDIYWDFRYTNMILRQMSNTSPKLLENASGVHYTVTDNKSLPADGHVRIRRIVDGEVMELRIGKLKSQRTRLANTREIMRNR